MGFVTKIEYKEEKHDWPAFVPEGATKLILGTFPTAERNRGAYDFFYPNPRNQFWTLLFLVDGKILKDYENNEPIGIRKQVLNNLKLGIADMGFKVLRQKGSSKDENLLPLEYTDIFSLLKKHPSIKKIILTSSTGTNSVASWFQHYCHMNAHKFTVPKTKLPISTWLQFAQRSIAVDIIASSSNASRIKGSPLVEMYRSSLLND